MIKLQKHVRLQITCADVKLLINTLLTERIPVQNVTYCSDLVVQITIRQADSIALHSITDKLGATVKIIRRNGILWQTDIFYRRPILVVILIVLFVTTCLLPGRVLFLSVEGNRNIPSQQILEAAELCGMGFGVSARDVRSEAVKNELLEKLPQLQWAGINVRGCTAVISVREKTISEQTEKIDKQVCSIVASRDGVIQNCTVYRGNPLCTVGQAVSAGQTLVSGYLDCGLLTKATRAEAEVTALTFRTLDLVAPVTTVTRGDISYKSTVYHLKIGKKLLKISKDSGNLDTTCVKIYEEKYLTLPGGFRLPVAIVKETQFHYSEGQPVTTSDGEYNWVEDFARKYLQTAMIAGEIVSEQADIRPQSDSICFYGRYACMEMIGQVRPEQTLTKDEIHD